MEIGYLRKQAKIAGITNHLRSSITNTNPTTQKFQEIIFRRSQNFIWQTQAKTQISEHEKYKEIGKSLTGI